MLLDLELKHVLQLLAALLVYRIIAVYIRIPKHHLVLPWAGGYRTALSQHFAAYASLKRGREFMNEAYEKYSSRDVVCIVPSFLAPQVVLPASHIPWMLSQPTSVLSAKKSQFHMIEARYTMLEPAILDYPVHEEVTKRELRRANLDQLTPALADEAAYALEHELHRSLKYEWQTLRITSFLKRTLNCTTMRAFAGMELSREPDYLVNSDLYEADLVRTGLLMRLWPDWTKPVIGHLLTLPNRYHNAKCAKYAIPMFEHRIAQWTQDPETLPHDMATWFLVDAMKKQIIKEQSADMLARRLLAIGFAAIHTSNMTTTNLLLDVASNSDCLRALEKEIAETVALYGNQWSKARLNHMIILDSTLRESMRVSTFVAKGNNRRVVSKGGVTLPNGTHIAEGAFLCIPTLPIHNDSKVYANPAQFVHDRFVPRKGQSEKDLLLTQAAAATTQPPYAAWGHGRHACPGRYFAVDMIKVVMATLLERYEIEPLATRPASKWIAETPVPPKDAALRMRVRKTPLGSRSD